MECTLLQWQFRFWPNSSFIHTIAIGPEIHSSLFFSEARLLFKDIGGLVAVMNSDDFWDLTRAFYTFIKAN
jgi:hypothetical protein